MINYIFKDDGIFSRRTYLGLFTGPPTPETNKREIQSLKDVARSFCWIKPYVVDSNTIKLPKRGNVAWITSDQIISKKENGCDCGSHACIIWFDDSNLDVRASMQKMLQEIDWEEIAENFDY